MSVSTSKATGGRLGLIIIPLYTGGTILVVYALLLAIRVMRIDIATNGAPYRQ